MNINKILNKVHISDVLSTLKLIPDNSIDIICTSPPYNKRKVKGKLVREVKYIVSDDKSEYVYQNEQIEVLDELYRITKPGGHIFYNHKLRWNNGKMIHPMKWLSQTHWDIRQEIIWDRTIAANIRGWRFWQIDERIYWMQKGIVKGEELKSNHAKMTSIWKIFPECKFKDHPAPFPIEFPTRCIYSVADTKEGLNVLDPYCGIGSTLKAAKILKHNYIGIDCSEEYVKMSEDRLKQMDDSNDDIKRVQEELKLHIVKKSYKQRKKK